MLYIHILSDCGEMEAHLSDPRRFNRTAHQFLMRNDKIPMVTFFIKPASKEQTVYRLKILRNFFLFPIAKKILTVIYFVRFLTSTGLAVIRENQ